MKDDVIHILTERGNTFAVTEDNESECQSCGETILWCITKSGKKMPVDIPDEPGAPTTSHFATCKDADQWRKPR